MEIISNDVYETEIIGEKIGKKLQAGDVIALTGDLGAGKTAFTRGVARGVGYDGRVTSPTFAIVNEYYCDKITVYHFDMYRISDGDELYNIGFDDYLNSGGILIIEWSENITEYLPSDIIKIDIKNIDENSRRLTVGGKYENISI
ncbi:MAG: tRNA (adenosine(37)-N6)-threonylcarbamoyltransferase complex ATPase subunit type 1 TsaE [Clostridia bacterium]